MEIAIVALVVVACSLYWLRRLVPASGPLFWRSAAGVVQGVGAPVQVRASLMRRAEQASSRRSGCGTCSKCSGGSCH